MTDLRATCPNCVSAPQFSVRGGNLERPWRPVHRCVNPLRDLAPQSSPPVSNYPWDEGGSVAACAANTYSSASSAACTRCPNGTDTAGVQSSIDISACFRKIGPGATPASSSVLPRTNPGHVRRTVGCSLCPWPVQHRHRRFVHAYVLKRCCVSVVVAVSLLTHAGRVRFATSTTACPANTYSANYNGTGSAQCLPCAPGTDTAGTIGNVDPSACSGTHAHAWSGQRAPGHCD